MEESQQVLSNSVIELCKQAYITRLFNRNPLLHFSAKETKSSDRFCVTDLFSDFEEQCVEDELSSITSSHPALSMVQGLLNNEKTDIEQPDKTLVLKLLKQKVTAKELIHMTGQHSLFVGYPLLYVSLDGKAPILAPLFMIPVTVTAQADKITIDRVRQYEDIMPITVNPLLTAWGERYKNITINWEEVVQHINQNSDSETENDAEMIFGKLKKLSQIWQELEEIQLSPIPAFEIAPTEKIIKGWAAVERQPRIVHSAVLGVVKYSGCALLQDLETLAVTPESELGILKALVTGRTNRSDETAPASNDADSWHVVDTDPPQKATIDQARTSQWMVIQGPPGTGKSQTIVNLVAQALAKQQTVAVFCEKPSALEVVKKRLAAVGLGELTLLIKKPAEQRLEVVKGIKNIKFDWDDLYQKQRPDYRSTQAEKIVTLEKGIDDAMQGFYTKENEGVERYANVKTRFHRLERDLGYEPMTLHSELSHQALINAISCFSIEQSRDVRWFKNEWESRVKLWEKSAADADFSTSPWREHRTDVLLDVTQLRQSLTAIKKIEKIDSGLLNKRSAHWISAHGLMGNKYAFSFIDNEKRNAQNLLHEAIKGLEKLGRVLKQHKQKQSIDALYIRTNLRYFETAWLDSIGLAHDVQQLMTDLEQVPIGKLLLNYFPNQPEQWSAQLEAAACAYWLQCWEKEYSSIYNSVSPLKRNIEQLQTLLDEKKSLDASVLRNDYRNRLRYRDALENNSLLRERSSKHGTKTQIRDLMNRGWDQTQKLHPVLLTTPEVACQILPLKAELFDLVIIDEASQMFTAEALPLIYRGKKIVVAGDNKQMPPSSFFNSSGSDEEEDEDEIEDEAVETKVPTLIPALDNACLLDAAEAVLPQSSPAQKLLKIHYRSSFRELIEFSNHAFYEGELEAPPGNLAAQGVLERPIEFNQLEHATFNKGVNEQEAQAIVQKIIEFWAQPQSPSLGVIVMNAQQKMKIEDLLREHAGNNYEFSARLEAERDRENLGEDVGFFIRNVENVQGDERDVIILGATYAGESRRFGPLATSEQGRRRLNVAITRAKQGLVVFCSLKPSSHSGDETMNDKWFFLAYLRYAKAVASGNMGEVEQILDKLNPKRSVQRNIALFDSDFEIEVAEFLEKNGYKAEAQAAESGFRIDLAVKCQDRLGYLCGIECDGAAFHSSWTARSRDIWRQKILEAKGWNIYRIWSTDWFNDQKREQEKILKHLKERADLISENARIA